MSTIAYYKIEVNDRFYDGFDLFYTEDRIYMLFML